MDEVDSIIRRFHSKNPEDFKKTSKADLILSLFGFPEDQRVLPFLLTVIADEIEDETLRIEAIKNLCQYYKISGVSKRIADTLSTVLLTDKDFLVRCFAAQAAGVCVDEPRLFKIMSDLAINQSEDMDIRSSAVVSLMQTKNRPMVAKTLRVLLSEDNNLAKNAKRVLDDWQL